MNNPIPETMTINGQDCVDKETQDAREAMRVVFKSKLCTQVYLPKYAREKLQSKNVIK